VLDGQAKTEVNSNDQKAEFKIKEWVMFLKLGRLEPSFVSPARVRAYIGEGRDFEFRISYFEMAK